jgi:hypothetical protein
MYSARTKGVGIPGGTVATTRPRISICRAGDPAPENGR